MFFPIKEESLNEREKSEYKIASQNLPEEVYFDCSAVKQNDLNSVEMDFILLPLKYGEDVLVNWDEIIHPKQPFQAWGYINADSSEETSVSGYLDFSEVPEQTSFINLYYHNFHNLYIPLENFKISFYNTTTSNYLFSYEYGKERFFNLLIGTFGRVSEGWKFYPKFYTYDKNKNFDSFKKER